MKEILSLDEHVVHVIGGVKNLGYALFSHAFTFHPTLLTSYHLK